MDKAILQHEALHLPAHDRALLANALLDSLDDESTREIETAWAAEAADRHEAYLRGEVTSEDGPAVMRELRRTYGG